MDWVLILFQLKQLNFNGKFHKVAMFYVSIFNY